VKVKTVMKSPPTIVTPETMLADAAARLRVDPARCALVLEDGRLAGLVTDADVRRAGPSTVPRLAERDLRVHAGGAVRVAEVMQPIQRVVDPDTDLPTAARVMRECRVTALAVIEDDEPVGVLTSSVLLPVAVGELDAGGRRGIERVLAIVEDDTDQALLEAAVRLAPGGVEAVHVLPALIRLGHTTSIPAWARAEVAFTRQRAAEAWLGRLLARVPGAPAWGRVLGGDATATIARLAGETSVDLIVVRRVDRRVAPLMRLAPCPVLAL
jgi:CBS domain-containing protein